MRPRDARADDLRYSPTIVDTERAERLREVVEDLKEVNLEVPILVEGKRDMAALRKLGLTGEIIAYNTGKGMHDFCMDLDERFGEIVILTDWDTEGERLYARLCRELPGLWEPTARIRQLIKVLCQKDVKDVEGIPALISRLEGDAGSW